MIIHRIARRTPHGALFVLLGKIKSQSMGQFIRGCIAVRFC
jgi:hypothetical protein